MLPQPNQPFTQLDTLTATLTAAGAPARARGSAAKLVGVEVFGSSSVMDDMAHAAVWLAVATGEGLARCCHLAFGLMQRLVHCMCDIACQSLPAVEYVEPFNRGSGVATPHTLMAWSEVLYLILRICSIPNMNCCLLLLGLKASVELSD
jgi:hypothetical protein